MKRYFNIVAILILLSTVSCEKWLTQTDHNSLSTEQAYSSASSINSIAANLYSRLRYEQDFNFDGSSYDLCSWDEAINSSEYWGQVSNKSAGYRQYYPYAFIRELNLHIMNLDTYSNSSISAEDKAYYIAEARYMRAYTYFQMVSRLGGVPIITGVSEYADNPLELAVGRNTEAEVYDFIYNEIQLALPGLARVSINMKSRATQGAALALQSRAMLYAGTIANLNTESENLGLNLLSGATGIEKTRANDYFQKCLQAYSALKKLGYSLYNNNLDKAANYAELFIKKEGNNELIFYKDYDGSYIAHNYTKRAIPRMMKSETKSGSQISPTLNLVDYYEKLSTRTNEAINPYTGDAEVELLVDNTTSHTYKVYNSIGEIFADRDPRLAGTILAPGSSFRGQSLDFRAGLAVPKAGGGYDLKIAQTIEDAQSNYYEGVKTTGEEGPHRSSGYVSHTGFLMRKFVDTAEGTQITGKGSTPYIVFRYGEVLLNAAEAAYMLNDNGISFYDGSATRALSLDCINQIRERAGGAAFKISDSELTFERIVNERTVELAFEDHRYNDQKRWRRADALWANDATNYSSVMYGLYPYQIYAPGEANHQKWIFRKVRVVNRTNNGVLNFNEGMYYGSYPITNGNPHIEPNPYQY